MSKHAGGQPRNSAKGQHGRRQGKQQGNEGGFAPAAAGELAGHYIASTHWDREWYEPFQYYRDRLVDVLDGAIDLLERDPEYRYYQTDGQSIVLEDYLEIRPEQR